MESEDKNKSKTVFHLMDNGALKVTGRFVIKDLKRNYEEELVEVLLCTCGRSGNKPFCDCSHEKPDDH